MVGIAVALDCAGLRICLRAGRCIVADFQAETVLISVRQLNI
jgi:hypothetical protein